MPTSTSRSTSTTTWPARRSPSSWPGGGPGVRPSEGERARMTTREERGRIVREHMESENRHEFDVTMATFEHPRYEIVATGEVHDGPEEVARYFADTRAAFPDQRNE